MFSGTGTPLELQSREVPPLKKGEVLVRNLYTTLCGSDLHTFCGLRKEKTPTVLGHEIVGRIEAFGDGHTGRDHKGKPLQSGDIITWSIFAADPESGMAAAGMPQKGEGLFKYGHAQVSGSEIFHGGLGEYCILKPYTAILKIPGRIPLPVAATVNCAVATVAGSLRMAGSVRDKTVLVTGTGLLGIICAAMCKDAGAAWVGAADVHGPRLDQAALFGADRGFLLEEGAAGTIEEIRTMHRRGGVDVAFDMSGSPDAMEMGLEALAVGGRAVWIGTVFKTRKLEIDAESVIRRLLTVKGLHNYNYADFEYALDFLERNIDTYPFASVVEKEFELSRAQEAFEYALQHKPLRVGIKIEN